MDGGKFPIRKPNPYMNESFVLLFFLLVVLVSLAVQVASSPLFLSLRAPSFYLLFLATLSL